MISWCLFSHPQIAAIMPTSTSRAPIGGATAVMNAPRITSAMPPMKSPHEVSASIEIMWWRAMSLTFLPFLIISRRSVTMIWFPRITHFP